MHVRRYLVRSPAHIFCCASKVCDAPKKLRQISSLRIGSRIDCKNDDVLLPAFTETGAHEIMTSSNKVAEAILEGTSPYEPQPEA